MAEWNLFNDGDIEILLGRSFNVPDAAVAESGSYAVRPDNRRRGEAGRVEIWLAGCPA